MLTTFTARPISYVEGLLFAHVTALRAPLAGGEPLIRDHERPPMPLTFVSKAADDLTPPRLRNMASELAILLHILHREVLRPQITSNFSTRHVVSFSMKSLRRS